MFSAEGISGATNWPAPVTSLSGNGVQLLYRVDLPNNDDSTRLTKAVLEELNRRFGTATVKVDTSVNNASRIAGLIGTMKVKGDSTAERPHRRSEVLSMPDLIETVDLEQLRRLAPPEPEPIFSDRRGLKRGWVARALETASIEYRAGKHDADVEWLELADCPFHPSEDAYKCGPGEDAAGRAMFHCFHDRGAGKGWQDFKAAVGLDGRGEGRPEEGPILVTGRTLADISDEPLPPLLFDIVETSGGTIMSAKGGTGKGATGVYLCGTAVEAGMTPLILDFERRPGEWARRLSGLCVPRDKVAYADRSDFPGDHKGRPLMELIDDIRSIIHYRGADLVVIDSIIAAVLAGEDKMKGDPQLPWEYMRAIEELGVPTVSFAHPPRGRTDGDPFGSVMWVNASRLVWAGSRAEGDGHRVRWRAHKENERGRIPGFILAFSYGDDGRMAGVERLDDETDTREWLQQALYAHGELSVAELAELLYEDDSEPPTPDELERTKARFRQQLNRMKKAGLVSRSGKATGKGAKWSNAVPFGDQEHEP